MTARTHSIRRTVAAFLLALPLTPGIARAIPGDLNGDGRFDAKDAAAALAASGGAWMPTYSHGDGDVAGGPGNAPDGSVTVADAVRLLRIVNGLDSLPIPALAAPATDRLTLSANLARNYQLPRAWRVEGTVKDTAGKPISSDAPLVDIFAEIVFTPQAEPTLPWSTPVAMEDGAYTAAVTSGVNNVAITTEFVEYDEDYNQIYDYWIRQAATPSTLNVAADTTKNFVRADLPAAGTLSGTVTAPGWTIDSLDLDLENGGTSYITLQEEGQPVPYSLKSGPGKGVFYVEGHAETDDGYWTDLWASLDGAPVTVGSGAATRNIVLPGVTTLRGKISGTDAYSWIQTYQRTADGSIVSADVDAEEGTGNYELWTPSGPSTVVLGIEGPDDTDGWRNLYYIQPLTVPAAGLVKDWTLPAIPTLHAFTGIVTGADGKPLTDAHVYVYPHTGPTEIAPGWVGEGETSTGSDGAFRLLLPTGDYEVWITPSNS
jgi:hypothetical protein